MQHSITRQRHEPKRRKLTIVQKSNLTPGMIRLVLEGNDLADFASAAPDDHVKLFIPRTSGEPDKRDYTPRHFDAAKRTLTLDFAVHDAGPATRWAIDARTGDTIEVGGPRGSLIVSPTFDWWLLIGDETALPAIGRRIEELPETACVISVVAVANAGEQQSFTTKAQHTAIWVHRPLDKADDAAPLLAALQKLEWAAGDGYVWIAAEAHVARTLRDYVGGIRQHPMHHLKAAGYWLKGTADAHVKIED